MAGGVNDAIERQSSSSSWADDDLPLDIINLIANGLHYIDQVSFRAVCKSWRAAHIVRYADELPLPWLMRYDSEEACCYLYDPFHKRKYNLLKSASLAKFSSKSVLDTKHDWVLSRGKKKGATETVLFFYNPFTDKIIELPAFDNKKWWITRATFSEAPTSPDCVVFALSRCRKGRNRIIVNRPPGGSRDMTNWTEFHIEWKSSWADNFVYVDGFLFYSLVSQQVFGAFDVASENEYVLPHPPLLSQLSRSYMTESDGKLLICYNLALEEMHRHLVCKLNRSQMNWVEIDSLDDDDRALFLTNWSSGICVPVERGSELANTIHSFGYWGVNDVSYKIQNGVSSELSPMINAYEDWETRCIGSFWIQPPRAGQ